MSDVLLITPPAIEPITLAEAKLQCGFGPLDDWDHAKQDQLSTQLRAFIAAARRECENYTRRAFITQTWQLQLDNFPGIHLLYNRDGFPSILLPKPPFQSIGFFRYVDVSGVLQTLVVDTTYGTNPASPQYGYQLDPGTETQPARLLPPWARPWPPVRMVPNNVLVQFTCGYGNTAASVPSPILIAIKFLVQHFYEVGGAADLPMPRVVRLLLDPYRNLVA